MPIIDMPAEMLLTRVRGGEDCRLTVDDLVEMLPKLGCEVEEVADVEQYICRVCAKIYDRTASQGPPPTCSQCGSDFRTAPDRLGELGTGRVLRLNMLAVRPDLFDPGGMARYLRGHLGLQTGLPEYRLSAARLRVLVDPALAEPESLRPHISCAVVRGVKLDHNTIKVAMNLQEDLHWALGRDRKLASIGVYDLDTLRGDIFHYDAVDPDGLRFVPLGFSPDDPEAAMTPREILERHKTGQAYAHLLRPLKKYPLLRDGVGTVLSMPPIINSESTRVTLQTRNFFIDVTGLSQRTVDRALNIVVMSLLEILPDIQVECVIIEQRDQGAQGEKGPEGEPVESSGCETATGSAPGASAPRFLGPAAVRITPDLSPTAMTLTVREAADTIGVDLNAGRLAELLEAMGHDVEEDGHAERLRVLVPAYRNDVMHPVDLIEDAAIAFGYEHLTPALVPTFTVGAPRDIEEHATVARRILTGLGFHQVMTLVLSNEAVFDKWRLPGGTGVSPVGTPAADEWRARAVQIANPISTEQTICRVSLLPGLLDTLAINKQYELPQQIFEVGDCCFVDPAAETGASEERYVAAAMIGTHVGYADIRAVADAFVHEMAATVTVQPVEHPSFIAGRAAKIIGAAGDWLGTMGEVHPEIIETYGLRHPVAVLEMNLSRLLGHSA